MPANIMYSWREHILQSLRIFYVSIKLEILRGNFFLCTETKIIVLTEGAFLNFLIRGCRKAHFTSNLLKVFYSITKNSITPI